jgi:tetratricopeptide (TPR) repeat protein
MPWLLIYDNLDDPVCWKAVHANHPEGPGSHIVLTTRLNTIGDRMHIPLKPLSEEAAVKFLLDKSHSTNEEAARAIARRVGCLALALSIAAAYIATEKCPIDEYLDLFSQHRAERLGSIPARIARTSTDLARGESSIVIKEDDPVFIAFEMSYKSICGPLPTGQVTNSIRLMQLFSFLDGNAISSSLLKRACATKSRYDSNGNLQTVGPKDDGVPPWLVESLTNSASGEWQKSKLVALTRKLATYSLLEEEDVDGEIAYGIHPLVQEFFREGYLDDQQRHRLQREALIIVDHSIPEEEGPWLPHQSYSYIFPQIQHHERVILALLQRAEPEPKLLHVGLRFSCVYLSQSRYGEAEKLLRVVYDGMKRVFGASHPDTLMAANGLAAVVSYRYEFAESNEWHEMVIEQAPANSMALYEAKRSLAQVYLRRGRLDAAMQLNEEVFKNLKDLLGPDHPYTLLAAMSLAGIYTQIPGRQRQGLELSEESHARYKRCLGSSSLTTLAAAIAVASAHLSLSNAEAAESTLLRVLKSCSETGNRFSYYGVLALSQLARCRLQQGRLQECLGDSLICRDLFVKLLGPESWEAQTTDLLTAQAFICLDCWEDAEKILPPLVDRVTRSLGPESMLAIHAAETTGALYYRMNNLDL